MGNDSSSLADLKGNTPFDSACPQGQILTGINLRVGSGVDQISSLSCRPPNRINDSSYGGTSVVMNAGGRGGNPYTWKCPLGSGIGSIVLSSDGKIIRTIKPICNNLQTSKEETLTWTYGNNGQTVGDPFGITCWGSGKYVTGISGTHGGAVSSMKVHCGDFTQAQKGIYTTEGKVNCCMGLYEGDNCPQGLSPQSSQCDQLITSWCQTHPNDPRCSCVMSEMTCPNKFDTNCIRKNGYQTSGMVKTPCPSVMNCTQFLSLSPGSQAVATNVDQTCSSGTTTKTNASEAGSSTYYIIMFLILMFIIIIATYFYLGGEKIEPSPPNI
jgi:hypothetical protein